MDYNGKVAWITGASSGIGASLARGFAARGGHVVLSGRDEGRLAEVAEDCGDTLILPFDVRDDAALAAATEKAIGWKGQIDLAVANAGISQRGRALKTDMQVYRDQLAEVERDLARGVIAVEEAASIRTEVSRRLLAAADAEATETDNRPAPARASRSAALAVAASTLISGGVTYGILGAPAKPAQPPAARPPHPQLHHRLPPPHRLRHTPLTPPP